MAVEWRRDATQFLLDFFTLAHFAWISIKPLSVKLLAGELKASEFSYTCSARQISPAYRGTCQAKLLEVKRRASKDHQAGSFPSFHPGSVHIFSGFEYHLGKNLR